MHSENIQFSFKSNIRMVNIISIRICKITRLFRTQSVKMHIQRRMAQNYESIRFEFNAENKSISILIFCFFVLVLSMIRMILILANKSLAAVQWYFVVFILFYFWFGKNAPEKTKIKDKNRTSCYFTEIQKCNAATNIDNDDSDYVREFSIRFIYDGVLRICSALPIFACIFLCVCVSAHCAHSRKWHRVCLIWIACKRNVYKYGIKHPAHECRKRTNTVCSIPPVFLHSVMPMPCRVISKHFRWHWKCIYTVIAVI